MNSLKYSRLTELPLKFRNYMQNCIVVEDNNVFLHYINLMMNILLLLFILLLNLFDIFQRTATGHDVIDKGNKIKQIKQKSLPSNFSRYKFTRILDIIRFYCLLRNGRTPTSLQRRPSYPYHDCASNKITTHTSYKQKFSQAQTHIRTLKDLWLAYLAQVTLKLFSRCPIISATPQDLLNA